MGTRTTVIAVAGRRIDAAGATDRRFPERNVDTVRTALLALFRDRNAEQLVASGACGADIVALEAAAELGMRTRLVLPFAPERFRRTSVVDRGESWGPRFDGALARAGDVIVVEPTEGNDDDAYAVVTARLIEDARSLAAARAADALAVAVWDGNPRPSGDATRDFIDQAARAGIDVHTISTV